MFAPRYFLGLAGLLSIALLLPVSGQLISSGSGWSIETHIDDNGFLETGKAEVRFGINALNGDWEMGLSRTAPGWIMG